jgi:hypothetical protein
MKGYIDSLVKTREEIDEEIRERNDENFRKWLAQKEDKQEGQNVRHIP